VNAKGEPVVLGDGREGSMIRLKLEVGEGGCALREAHFWVGKGALVRGEEKEGRGRLATD